MLFNVEEEIHIIQNDIEKYLMAEALSRMKAIIIIADQIVGLQNSKKYSSLIASVPILTQKSQFD